MPRAAETLQNDKMRFRNRAAGNGPGQLLLPFGQFTFRVKGAKSPFRVQSSSFLNFSSSENWTGSGAKRLFRHAEMPSLWMAFHMALKHDGSHSQFVKTKSHPSEAVVEPRVRCGTPISTKNAIQRMVFFVPCEHYGSTAIFGAQPRNPAKRLRG